MDFTMKKCNKQCEPQRLMRKKKNVYYFECLPDDILHNILILLPAELLRYRFKYVCKRWFNIITNRILFDQASLIVQKLATERFAAEKEYKTRLVDIYAENLNLRMKEQYLDIPCKGRIRSSCNEIFLITDPNKFGALYVYNLVTKVGLTLPSCTLDCNGHFGCKCGLGVGFDKFKGSYKVVHVSVGPKSIQCEMLVLKNDQSACTCTEWKRINGPSYIGKRHYYWEDPVTVEGRYFHWDVHSDDYIVSMDIVKERFRKTCLPESGKNIFSNEYFLVEMGGFLSLLLPVSREQIDIWDLKDYRRSIWQKVRCIKSYSYLPSVIYPGRNFPVPIGSLKDGGHIIFRKSGTESGLYVYDLKLDYMSKLNIQIIAAERCLVQSMCGFCLGF